MKKNYILIFFLLLACYSYGQNVNDSNLTTSQTVQEIEGLRMYPNPVTNGILRINTFENAEKQIQIFDVLGKQVLTRKMKTQHLNVSALNSGVYILKISEKGKTATRKLVIK